MTAMERMLEYTGLAQEPPTEEEGGGAPPPGWPASGALWAPALGACAHACCGLSGGPHNPRNPFPITLPGVP